MSTLMEMMLYNPRVSINVNTNGDNARQARVSIDVNTNGDNVRQARVSIDVHTNGDNVRQATREYICQH